MKAKVILTGDIIDVTPRFNSNSLHHGDDLYVSENKVYYGNQLDFVNTEDSNINWEQRRYEIAKEAMQGMLSNTEVLNADDVIEYKGDYAKKIANSAVHYADALIKELKGEKGIVG